MTNERLTQGTIPRSLGHYHRRPRSRRKWHSFKGTKRQAQVECARLISALKADTYLEPSKTTLAQFLERWLEHIRAHVTPKSHERYAGLVRTNVIPLLGSVHLTKLKPIQISTAYSTALAGGRKDGKEGGLSPRSVGHMHRVLKQALGQAVRWGELNRNPADTVNPPKVEWKPMETFDLAQTAEMIEFIRPFPIFMPSLLAVLCGLRRGEICALRWRNVDLAAGQIAIVESLEQTKAGLRIKSPKNGKGRTVALSATVIDELRAHRRERAQQLLKLGVALTDDDLVIAHADNSIVPPIWVSQQWARTIRKTKLAHLRFHDLRHAHATHLLANGINPKIASERLGHSRVGITLDLYSHVMPGMQEDAAAMVDAQLQLAIQNRKPIR